MSWAKARTVRSFLTALLVVSGLALAPSLYAENQDKPRGRGNGRDNRQASVQRPANQREAPPAATQTKPSAEAKGPVRPADQGRVVQPAPLMRSDQGGRGWGRQQARPDRETRAVPVDQGGSRPAMPQPSREELGWQRQGRATPYQLYSAPEQRTAPESPRQMKRPQPVARPDPDREAAPQRPPTLQDRPKAQPWPGGSDQSRDRLRDDRPQLGPEPQRNQERLRKGEAGRQGKETPAPKAKGRVQGVPEASFRGPQADRNLTVVRPDDRERVQKQLRDLVRNRNQERARLIRGRPTLDVVGNPISTDITFIVRDNISRLSVGFTHIRRTCGDPTFVYVFGPRNPRDYWDGYWDGYADGYSAGKHHFHGHHVVVSFYYGYYWSDPFWFAFYYPGYYPAIYTYWGWSPGWVYPERCYYAPADYTYAPVSPYRYYGGDYYLDERGADQALNDIRSAWYDGDISTFAYHLTDDVDIRVYFDGEYDYSTTTEDYYAMTADAMATTQTTSLDFDQPIWLSSHEFFVTGRHMFYDPDGNKQGVYVSYRLRKLGGEWYIVAVGSSLEPIQHQYHDFRY